MTEQELKTRKGELVKAIRSLADKSNEKGRAWTPADEKDWSAVDAELSDVQSKIDDRAFDSGPETALYGREDRMGNQGGADPIFRAKTHSGEVFRDTATGRTVPVVRGSEKFVDAIAASRSREWQEAREGRYDGLSFGGMLRALATGASSDAESRALAEGQDGAGGYMVPHYLSAQLIDLMRAKARVFQAGAGTVELTSDRNSFAKLLTDPTPGWRSENSSVTESQPTFGSIVMQPKMVAVRLLVSRELLEDGVNTSSAIQNTAA